MKQVFHTTFETKNGLDKPTNKNKTKTNKNNRLGVFNNCGSCLKVCVSQTLLRIELQNIKCISLLEKKFQIFQRIVI